MEPGMETLVEGIIPAIALCGEKGATISFFLELVKKILHRGAKAKPAPVVEAGSNCLSDAERATAIWAWNWLRDRPDILINGDRRWNSLELESVLLLREEGADDGDARNTPGLGATGLQSAAKTEKENSKRPQTTLTIRPRICVTENMVWKTIAGHDKDFKRIPPLEWKCLLGIASAGTEGIVQPALVDLVGQDKRSVPKRTDSLAEKGYIAKRTFGLYKIKTSKMWIAKLAPKLSTERAADMDLSREALTKDLQPVPWAKRWEGHDIDMDAFGRSLIGIVKAWKVIKYGDLRTKMGMGDSRWRMKILSRLHRRFISWGVLKNSAAAFPGSRKIWKDCIKFVRDATSAEWSAFLATGKKTASLKEAKKRLSMSRAGTEKKTGKRKGRQRVRRPSGPGLPPKQKRTTPAWVPEKPIHNTLFEVIQSAGTQGVTTPETSAKLVGYNFRRYVGTALETISKVKQPRHLAHLQISSVKVRSGKTQAYKYSAPNAGTTPAHQHAPGEGKVVNPYGFGALRFGRFSSEPAASLSDLSKVAATKAKPSLRTARHQRQDAQPVVEDTCGEGAIAEQVEAAAAEAAINAVDTPRIENAARLIQWTGASTLGVRTRSRDQRADGEQIAQRPCKKARFALSDEQRGTPQPRPGSDKAQQENTQRARDRGVNPETRNSLGPASRALVVNCTSETMNDGESLGMAGPPQSSAPDRPAEAKRGLVPAKAGQPPGQVATGSTETKATEEANAPGKRHPKRKQGPGGGARCWKCEKCGGTWKNESGLKYHVQSSRTPCNASYVAAQRSEQVPRHQKMQQAAAAWARNVPCKRGKDKAIGPVRQDLGGAGRTCRRQKAWQWRACSLGDIRGLAGGDDDGAAASLAEEIARTRAERRVQEACTLSAQAAGPTGLVDLGARDDAAPAQKSNKASPATMAEPGKHQVGPVPDDEFSSKDESSGLRLVGSRKPPSPSPQTQQDREQFRPRQNYDRISVDNTKSTALAADIINYLLDQNEGVFPYNSGNHLPLLHPAVAKVFWQHCPDGVPPFKRTISNLVQKLEDQKMAVVHHFGLRDETTQKFMHPSLLVRCGVDETGPVVTRVKEAMRDQFPNGYWPEPFVPSEQDWARLDGLKGATPGPAPKKAAKDTTTSPSKPLQPLDLEEIEVLGAPVYAKLGTDTSSREPAGPGFRGRKRRGGIEDLVRPPKRMLLGGNKQSRLGRPFDGRAKTGRHQDQDLLPRSYGRQFSKMLPAVGRMRNPGLDSLPPRFFGGPAPGPAFCFEFLEERPAPHYGLGPTHHAHNQSPALVFLPALVLKDSGHGVWPNLSHSRFENLGTSSFTTQGYMPSLQTLFALSLPASVEEMADGPATCPSGPDQWKDQDYAAFCVLLDRCLHWEQSAAGQRALLGASTAPAFSFLNVSPPQSHQTDEPIELHWSEDNHFGPETLPYNDLVTEEDDQALQALINPRPPGRPAAAAAGPLGSLHKHCEKNRPGRKAGPRKLQAYKVHRELTAYPQSMDDFFRRPGHATLGLDWKSKDVMMAALVAVTALTGGVGKSVDWGIVMRLFPELTNTQLRRTWLNARKDRKSGVLDLYDKFRKGFLEAYGKGEWPKLDFDHALDFDWLRLVKWTATLDVQMRGPATLPATRRELARQYRVVDDSRENRHWRETFVQPNRSTFDRFQDINFEPLAMPLHEPLLLPQKHELFITAVSWMRALCLTPTSLYPDEAPVAEKLSSLGADRGLPRRHADALLAQANTQLQRDSLVVMSKSASPEFRNGRKWRLAQAVLKRVDRGRNLEKLEEAVRLKKRLDNDFAAGKTRWRMRYWTDDGTVLALLDLAAHGRVRVESSGCKKVPLGFQPGRYETRKFDNRRLLHFRLQVVPTDRYLFDDVRPGAGADAAESDELSAARRRMVNSDPPTDGPAGAIPIWCDLFGKLSEERWLKYLAMVLLVLANQGPMHAKFIADAVKPALMEFEADLILRFLREAGVLSISVPGIGAGLTEWWWTVVAAQRRRFELLKDTDQAVVVQEGEQKGARKPLPTGRVMAGMSTADTNETATDDLEPAGRAREAM